MVLVIPAIVLIAWLIVAQLPRWTAPQPGWFAPMPQGGTTPGVCAAVASLKLYSASRINPADGIGIEAARERANEIAAEHYSARVITVGTPLAVEAALSGSARQALYLVTLRLEAEASDETNGSSLRTDAVIYLDAVSGSPLRLITALEDSTGEATAEAKACAFDVRAALIAAIKSPPLLLLAAYILVTSGLLAVRGLFKARGMVGTWLRRH